MNSVNQLTIDGKIQKIILSGEALKTEIRSTVVKNNVHNKFENLQINSNVQKIEIPGNISEIAVHSRVLGYNNQGLPGPIGPQGIQGEIGPAGIIAQPEKPIDSTIIWLDTDDPLGAYDRATQTQAEEGVDNENYMTALRTKQAITVLSPKLTKATQTQAEAGTDNDNYMTALRTKQLVDVVTQTINNNLFPIGRGFIDFTDTDYSDYLGFVWEKTLIGMVPIGKDTTQTEFNTLGKTGGNKNHTMTEAQMPTHTHIQNSHTHGYGYSSPKRASDGSVWDTCGQSGDSGGNVRTTTGTTATNQDAGSSETFSILPPYEVVNFWKRIS